MSSASKLLSDPTPWDNLIWEAPRWPFLKSQFPQSWAKWSVSYASVDLRQPVFVVADDSKVDRVCLVCKVCKVDREGGVGLCQLLSSLHQWRPEDQPRSQPWWNFSFRLVGLHPSQHSENLPQPLLLSPGPPSSEEEDVGSQMPGFLSRPVECTRKDVVSLCSVLCNFPWTKCQIGGG